MTGLEVTRPMFVIPVQAGIQATRDGLREKDLRRVPEEASSRRLVKFYNNSERPHQGCRNMGSRPIVTVRKFIQTCEEKTWSYRHYGNFWIRNPAKPGIYGNP